jgi:hypothetical protein
MAITFEEAAAAWVREKIVNENAKARIAQLEQENKELHERLDGKVSALPLRTDRRRAEGDSE